MTENLVCSECGHADEAVTAADAIAALRRFGKRYRAPLTRFLPGEDGDTLLRTRPSPDVWSALEYAAHVRDVYAWYDERVRRALVEDRPRFEGPGHEAVVDLERYNEQDPAMVADQLAVNAERLADTFEAVPLDGWDRVYIRPGGEERTVLLTARRAVHEGNHHLLDIGRVMRTVREGAT